MNAQIRRGILKLALAVAATAIASLAALALAVTTGGATITTVAGVTRTAPIGLRGSETSLYFPRGAMGLYSLGVQPPGGGWYSTPVKIGIDSAGNHYIPDALNNRVVKLSPPTASGPGVLPGASAGRRVRKVDPNRIITTFAGTGANGFSGDGGPATSAMLNNPESVSNLDAGGTIYIADRDNQRVRRVTADGVITTVAGTGTPGEGGEFGRSPSPANSAQLRAPRGVGIRPNGTLYIADSDNGQIRKLTFG